MAQDFFTTFGVDKIANPSAQWTVEQDRKLREIFNTWDEDGSNYLTKSEMRPIVKKMLSQGFTFKSAPRYIESDDE